MARQMKSIPIPVKNLGKSWPKRQTYWPRYWRSVDQLVQVTLASGYEANQRPMNIKVGGRKRRIQARELSQSREGWWLERSERKVPKKNCMLNVTGR